MNVGLKDYPDVQPGFYDVADVISTYVYRQDTDAQYSFGAAVGLFNS